MKKTYIAPEMEVINVMAECNMMAASTYSDTDTVAAGEELAGDRRGGWGNLWD